MRFLLGAFGDPGHAFPAIALGRGLVARGHEVTLPVAVEGADVVTEVVVGGAVSNNKGINLPGVAVSVPALSQKDADDLRWALRRGVDLIALSFVRDAKDA